MDKLSVINLPATANLPISEVEKIFTLKTCQRTLAIGRSALLNELPNTCFEFYVGVEAYQFLLEVICGLKSHLLAESEIASQFKTAYNEYSARLQKDTGLLTILEKLFKDAKEVRSQFLNQVGQHSYASITRSLISRKRAEGRVLILGSGNLAFSLAKLLKKKYDVTLSARNQAKREEICSVFSLKSIAWENQEAFYYFPIIINTVGTEEVLFEQNFFQKWLSSDKIFIDLASPSPLKTSYTYEEGIVRLEDIFKESDQRSEFKQQRIAIAKEFIAELAYRRHLLLITPPTEKEVFLGP